jgi:3-mercaptopyruvate sulfurtransferase SseA
MTKLSNMMIFPVPGISFESIGELIMTDNDWQDRVKGLLKSELKRRGVSYKQLAEKLAELGIDENDRNIANKLARGGFSAVFLVQCLSAIGCDTVHLQT